MWLAGLGSSGIAQGSSLVDGFFEVGGPMARCGRPNRFPDPVPSSRAPIEVEKNDRVKSRSAVSLAHDRITRETSSLRR